MNIWPCRIEPPDFRACSETLELAPRSLASLLRTAPRNSSTELKSRLSAWPRLASTTQIIAIYFYFVIFIYLFIYLFIYIFISSVIYLSIHLFIHLYFTLSAGVTC